MVHSTSGGNALFALMIIVMVAKVMMSCCGSSGDGIFLMTTTRDGIKNGEALLHIHDHVAIMVVVEKVEIP